MVPIRGVLFDKDGTLVDFHATWLGVAERAALDAALGDPNEAARLLRAVGFDGATGQFAPDSVFAAGSSCDVVATWYPDLSAKEREPLVRRFDDISVEHGPAAVALPGVVDALFTLKEASLLLGVATNDSTRGSERTLDALGIRELFEASFGYDAVPEPKPAIDSVLAFCEVTGLSPLDLAVVGDSRFDLEMGRDAGCGLAISVASGTGTYESLAPYADVVLASVADLPSFLAVGTTLI